MSEALDTILQIASQGTTITVALSADTVQLIFFALGFLQDKRLWLKDEQDEVTDADWAVIYRMCAIASYELLG